MGSKRAWYQCPVCQQKTWGEPNLTPQCLGRDGAEHEATAMTLCRSTRDWPHGRPEDAGTRGHAKVRPVREAVRRLVLGGTVVVEVTDQGLVYREPAGRRAVLAVVQHGELLGRPDDGADVSEVRGEAATGAGILRVREGSAPDPVPPDGRAAASQAGASA